MEENRNEENLNEEELKEFDFDEFEEELEMKEKSKNILDTIKSGLGTVASKVKDAGTWVVNHPEEAGAAAAAVFGVGLLAKTASDIGKLNRTVYDEHTGESVELKKKLSNKDKIELDERMSEGESKIKALNRMNKIK